MAQYRECPNCGAHLDFGERCDCIEEREKDQERKRKAARTMSNAVFLPKHTIQYELKLAVGFNDR